MRKQDAVNTDSWEAGLEEFPSEPEPLECPEEAFEMVDILLSVEDMMYGITTDPTRLFFFSVREQGWKYTCTNTLYIYIYHEPGMDFTDL